MTFVRASRLYDAESGETTRWDWPRTGERVDAFTDPVSGEYDLKLISPESGAWVEAADAWEVRR